MATPHFPKKTLDKMKNSGISESDILDTFNNGEHFTTSTGSHMMVKRCQSYRYELGLYDVIDNFRRKAIVIFLLLDFLIMISFG